MKLPRNFGAVMVLPLQDPQSKTWTYIVAEPESRQAVIVDSVWEQKELVLNYVKNLDLELHMILETHVHADHVTGASWLREKTGAKVGASSMSEIEGLDVSFADGDLLTLGRVEGRVFLTPGHTNSCTSYLIDTNVFTGDALLIGGCGRTDFQEGSAKSLYQSVHEKLFSLPDETIVFPGHDYMGRLYSTIGWEKSFNPRLGTNQSLEDFEKTMSNLNLAPPQKIKIAVPNNLRLGKEYLSAK